MVARCTNPNRHDFSYYGGRGITVCKRWRESFATFLVDMGKRPTEKHSLDRKDNSLGYGPKNCRWATKDEQMQNTRGTRLITFRGETMGLNAWAKRLGCNKESLRTRLNKWSIERAITQPFKSDKRRTPGGN